MTHHMSKSIHQKHNNIAKNREINYILKTTFIKIKMSDHLGTGSLTLVIDIATDTMIG